ncbi:hypothetical protein [Paracoccus litorisediminis]|uniref:Helix-turn-helix domain-containing protein n=1 Tax=Paracoccus litorisediminis TaxID=2006130 RepID=A0A844HUK4_9RHOB|nr:hypothetical protein [Paracoccus litorisediminis]MTH62144.1 hypothetical protein [Paracoccus litorisediminis]
MLRDVGISIEARGLLALMMTYSDEWVFSVTHLRDLCGVGRDKMRKMTRELSEAGYLVRVTVADESGYLGGSRWDIVDDPFEPGSRASGDGSPDQDIGDGPDGDGGSESPKNTGSDRPPDNQGIGATEGLKNRPPENPTVGESGAIRKPSLKKTNLKNPLTPAKAGDGGVVWWDSFLEFWGAYPDPVERDAAWREYQLVLEAGEITPEGLLEAARSYAKSRHVEKGYGKKPANWLSSGAWREEWEVGRKAKADEQLKAGVDYAALAVQWVPVVKAGRSYAAGGIRPDVAHYMLDRGLVTEAELRRVGVTVRLQ